VIQFKADPGFLYPSKKIGTFLAVRPFIIKNGSVYYFLCKSALKHQIGPIVTAGDASEVTYAGGRRSRAGRGHQHQDEEMTESHCVGKVTLFRLPV
jgi:hypothetical protein